MRSYLQLRISLITLKRHMKHRISRYHITRLFLNRWLPIWRSHGIKEMITKSHFFCNWNISFQFQSERAWFALFTIFLCVIKTLKYCAAPDAVKLIGQSLLFKIKETLDHDICQLNFRLYNVHNWSSFILLGAKVDINTISSTLLQLKRLTKNSSSLVWAENSIGKGI